MTTTTSDKESEKSTMRKVVSLQIPEGAEPGDFLTFTVDGVDLEIPIPLGSQTGEILEIQVGGAGGEADGDGQSGDDSNDHNENNDNHPNPASQKHTKTGGPMGGSKVGQKQEDDPTTVKIQCISGVIDLVSSAPTHASKPKTPDDKSNNLKVEHIDDGTYAHPWPAGEFFTGFFRQEGSNDILKNLFLKTAHSNNNISVLELGSGMGMVGLSFAINYIHKSTSLPLLRLRRVMLSDVDAGLPLLNANIERNRDVLPTDVDVTAKALQWTTDIVEDDSDHENTEKFNLALASDVLYNAECIPALVATIKRHIKTDGNLLIAVRWRKPDLERQFFEELDGWNGKHWQLVNTMHCPLSWMEYGLPTSDASNRYFHQTMVSVNGKPSSLADILDSQNSNNDDNNSSCNNNNAAAPKSLSDIMTDEEADVFESFFIQIYCLCDSKISLNSRKRSHEEIEEKGKPTKKSCREN